NSDFFPWAKPTPANYFRATFWTGFGGPELGPFKIYWNDLSLRFEKRAPQIAVRETYDNESKDIYISGFTDERYDFSLYDEMQIRLLPNYFDLNLGFAFGKSWDNDNTIRPDDYNSTRYSIVIRPVWYITEHLHYLLELVYAREKSTIGNRYREHFNSIKSNTGGMSDTEGLEWGDTDTKYTYQIKTGFTINPAGRGIYSRPVIRLLYGVQHSNVQAAFGNSFEESLNRRNQFNLNRDIHWHHMVRVEFEHWFSVSGWEDGYTPPLAQQTQRLSQVHKGVPVDPNKPKPYDIYTALWGGYLLPFGPLTTALADRLVNEPDGCLGLNSRQCVINYTLGGVSGGAHVRVRSHTLEYTAGLWYLPVYSAAISRTTGDVSTNVAFFVASAGMRYFPEFIPSLKGVFVGAELGYGIPMIENSVAGDARDLNLGTYFVAMLSIGYQYRLSVHFSVEAGTQFVFMPTTYVMLGATPYMAANYHL
ncbi:MAG TPA: carbohydrate porin, partial [Turneriella sp.]|nr:carbohydrate porin [Turneriella sp.]